MVKAYLRYDLAGIFGVVTSNSNIVYDHSGKLVITAALENVNIWNVKQGTLVSKAVQPALLWEFPVQGRLNMLAFLIQAELCIADQNIAKPGNCRKGSCRGDTPSAWPQRCPPACSRPC